MKLAALLAATPIIGVRSGSYPQTVTGDKSRRHENHSHGSTRSGPRPRRAVVGHSVLLSRAVSPPAGLL